MSVLTNIWHHLTKDTTEREQYRVAFTTAAASPTMSHYIERLSAYLQVMAPQNIIIEVYENILEQDAENRFQKDYEKQPFDGVVAMDCLAGQALLRLKHHIVMEAPAVILGYQEMLPATLPHNVVGFFSPDSSAEHFQLMRKMYPHCGKLLIAGKRRVIERVDSVRNLIQRCKDTRTVVEFIYVDDPKNSIEEQFAAHASGAVFLHTVFDLGVFCNIEKLVTCAHEYGLLVVASNLHSIHYGADIVIGLPETKVFRYVAHRFMMLLHGVNTHSSVFHMPLELHCNSRQLEQQRYVLDNIGAMFVEGDVSIHIHANKEAAR